MKRLLIFLLIFSTISAQAQTKVVVKVPGAGGGGGATYTPTITTQATSTTLTTSYETWVFTGSSAATFTLPALAGGTGRRYVVKNKGGDTLTLAASGSDKIYTYKDTTLLKVAPGHSYTLQNDGDSWAVTSAYFHNALVAATPATTPANTTPEPPTLTADDVANTLQASHALGTSEIVVSENNGTYAPYGGTISVGDVDRAEGYWKFKTRAATGRNESPVALSPAFTVAAAGGGGGAASAEVSDYKTRLTARGYTLSAGETTAYETFVQTLLDAGIYSKVVEVYSFVHGTTGDPRTVALKEAAHDIESIIGSPGYSARGIAFNGTSYGQFPMDPATLFASDPYSTGLGVYVQDVASQTGIEMGATNSYAERFALTANNNGSAYAASGLTANAATVAAPATAGFFFATRSAANSMKLYHNGSLIASNTNTESGTLPTGKMLIGAWNTRGDIVAVGEHATRTISLAILTRGMSDSEAATLNSAVAALATALGFNY